MITENPFINPNLNPDFSQTLPVVVALIKALKTLGDKTRRLYSFQSIQCIINII